MSRVHAMIVARRHELPGARVLAAQLRRHHADWEQTVLLLPGLGEGPRPDEPFALVRAADVVPPELGRVLSAAPATALAALARPLAIAHALEGEAETVVLLAADVDVMAPLDALLAPDADVVVVPRVLGPLPDDGLRPDATDLLEAGELEDGAVVVRDTAAARDVLDWWIDRARESAELAIRIDRDGPARMLANPLAQAHHTGARVARVEDAGIGTSSWNLHERPLARAGDGATAGGRPLALVRWEGFRADRPWWLDGDHNRVLVLDDPVLTELAADRARRLIEAGWAGANDLDAAPAVLPNGLRFDRRLRRMYTEAIERGVEFGDLASTAGADAFLNWLTEPAPHGAHVGLTRYHADVWDERKDVQEAYPDLDGPDGEGFAGWLWIQGRPEMDLQTALMPPWPEFLGDPPASADEPPPVLVTGYLAGVLGLGQAARAYATALEAAGLPVATRAVRPQLPVGRAARGAPQGRAESPHDDLHLPDGVEPEVHLLCVNADQTIEFADEFGREELARHYTVGHWAWETDLVPERWDAAFALVDELWVNSTYVAANLARAGDKPVVVVPSPVSAPDAGDATVPFPMPDGFVFLFVFDFFSTLERKNPLGLVDAFTRAFAPGEGPALVLKTINAQHRPEAHERLRHAIADRPDIHLVDAPVSQQELAAVFRRADAYVSLHRSEGFGLTLAEAMALGKPVIATGYSGNTDFMTPHNSWLVDYRITAVGPEAEHYPAEGHWAEPDVDAAARAMREVVAHPQEAADRGARAAADVAAALSFAEVGRIARQRLLRIAALRSGAPQPAASEPWPLSDLDSLLSFDIGGSARGRGARGRLRRVLLRAMRPFTMHERRLDEAVVGSVHRLWFDLARERAERERAERRLAALEQRIASDRSGQD